MTEEKPFETRHLEKETSAREEVLMVRYWCRGKQHNECGTSTRVEGLCKTFTLSQTSHTDFAVYAADNATKSAIFPFTPPKRSDETTKCSKDSTRQGDTSVLKTSTQVEK